MLGGGPCPAGRIKKGNFGEISGEFRENLTETIRIHPIVTKKHYQQPISTEFGHFGIKSALHRLVCRKPLEGQHTTFSSYKLLNKLSLKQMLNTSLSASPTSTKLYKIFNFFLSYLI